MTITAEEVKAMAELLVWLRKAPRGEIEFTLEGRKSVIRPDYILADHADLLDRLSAQAQGSGTPFAYAYEYPTYDGPVIRFETNGREINGSKPTRAIPLYTHPSAGPAVSEALELIIRNCNGCEHDARYLARKLGEGGFSEQQNALVLAEYFKTFREELKTVLAALSAPSGPSVEDVERIIPIKSK